MNNESDILGDKWAARLKREHERHAGIPSYGWCPLNGQPRPEVRMITPQMIDTQRLRLRLSWEGTPHGTPLVIVPPPHLIGI